MHTKIYTYFLIFSVFTSLNIQSYLDILPSELIYLIAANNKHIFWALRETSKKYKKALDDNLDNSRLYTWYVSGISDNRYNHIPFVWAVIHSHDYIISRMLKNTNIDINAENVMGMTAFSYACFRGDLGLIRNLLPHKDIDVNKGGFKKGISSWNLAQFPVPVGGEYLLMYIHRHPFTCSDGSPLMLAINRKRTDAIKLLLKYKNVDVNMCNARGNTALLEAVRNGNLSIFKLILNSCSLTLKEKKDEKTINTLLITAIKCGHLSICKAIVRHFGIDLSNMIDLNGRTPLIIAIENKQKKILSWLVFKKNIDVNGANNVTVPLMTAIIEISIKSIKILLNHKDIDVNKEVLLHSTPLIKAIRLGNKEIVTLLLNHKGIDINKKDSVGDTPFDVAKHYKRKKIVKLLKAKGAVSSEKGRSFFSWFKRKKS